MFGFEFYPTPRNVIERMLSGEQIEGKVVLEPSAGKGNIVDVLHEYGAKEVLACEIDENLRLILQTKCRVIGEDFLNLKSDDVSHVQLIVMNPPFSKISEHILHVYEIAPAGCVILSLCNVETVKNPYSANREQVVTLVNEYGSFVELGECFEDAERYTSVNVGLIRIQKPGAQYEQEFDGFFMDNEPEEETGPGLMPYNVIRDLVNRYVEAVKIFDEQLLAAVKMKEMTKSFFHSKIAMRISIKGCAAKRNEFKKDLQKSGWQFIFDKMNMQKYATKGLKEDINKFVETQEKIPFTMANIYRMLDMIVQTHGQRMDKAIEEVFDSVTRHHDENRYGVEGWKTNSHYLLTKRFIVPTVAQMGWSGQVSAKYDSNNTQRIEDLVKALCYITGENYDNQTTLYHFIEYRYFLKKGKELIMSGPGVPVMSKRREEVEEKIGVSDSIVKKYYGAEVYDRGEIEWGKWVEWGFFRFRCYKKGTMHLEFKDEDVWAQFNQRIAKIKGYPLPEQKRQTKYQEKQNGRKSPPKASKPAKVLFTMKVGV